MEQIPFEKPELTELNHLMNKFILVADIMLMTPEGYSNVAESFDEYINERLDDCTILPKEWKVLTLSDAVKSMQKQMQLYKEETQKQVWDDLLDKVIKMTKEVEKTEEKLRPWLATMEERTNEAVALKREHAREVVNLKADEMDALGMFYKRECSKVRSFVSIINMMGLGV